MEVLLNQDVAKLGFRGDIVSVKGGYFRNYLWPRGLATVADKKVRALAEQRKDKLVMKRQQVLENAKEVAEKLKGLKVTIEANASEKGKLYASVSESDVAEAIGKDAKLQLDPEMIKMEDHFKEAGEYEVKVNLGEFTETVKVLVEAKAEEK